MYFMKINNHETISYIILPSKKVESRSLVLLLYYTAGKKNLQNEAP